MSQMSSHRPFASWSTPRNPLTRRSINRLATSLGRGLWVWRPGGGLAPPWQTVIQIRASTRLIKSATSSATSSIEAPIRKPRGKSDPLSSFIHGRKCDATARAMPSSISPFMSRGTAMAAVIHSLWMLKPGEPLPDSSMKTAWVMAANANGWFTRPIDSLPHSYPSSEMTRHSRRAFRNRRLIGGLLSWWLICTPCIPSVRSNEHRPFDLRGV